MAKKYAEAIRAGKKNLEDVPARWQEETREKYRELYGEELG